MKVKCGLSGPGAEALAKLNFGTIVPGAVLSVGHGGDREHWYLKGDTRDTLAVRIWDRHALDGAGERQSSHSSKDIIIESPVFAAVGVFSARLTSITLRTDLGLTALWGDFDTAARSIRSKYSWGRVTTMVQMQHS